MERLSTSFKRFHATADSEPVAVTTRRRALHLLGGLLAASPIGGAFAQTAAPKPARPSGPGILKPLMAVNLSGRQRTLALRAARGYAQLGLGVTPPRSMTTMKGAAAAFELTLTGLRTNAAGRPSEKLFADVAQLWPKFAELLREVPALEAMVSNNELLERIVTACTAAHDQVVREVGTPEASLVRSSGRQRFLSQRAAQLFIYREWGVSRGDYKDIQTLSAESKSIRTALRDAPGMTAEVRRELDLAETQWLFFDDSLAAQMRGQADDTSRRNVATTSDRLFEVFEGMTLAVVKAYEG